MQIRKEAIKLSLFTHDIIAYIENLKESAKNLLEQMNVFNKVAAWEVKKHLKVHCIPTKTAMNTGSYNFLKILQ